MAIWVYTYYYDIEIGLIELVLNSYLVVVFTLIYFNASL